MNDIISNASIIKNQESDGIDIFNEQIKEISNSNLEKFEPVPEEPKGIIIFLNKYKFWVISIIILVLLLFMAVKRYTSDNKLGGFSPTSSPVITLELLQPRLQSSKSTSSVSAMLFT